VPRVCTVCSSPNRTAIDEAVTRGESFRRIAPQYGVSDRALRRHAAEHVPAAIVKAHEAAETTRADGLLEILHEGVRDARRLRDRAEKEGDLRCAVAAVKTLVDIVERLADVGERLAQAEATKPPEQKPVLSDAELTSAIETLLSTAAAREEKDHVH
jgi:transposase-like protein